MEYKIVNKDELDEFIYSCINNGSAALAEKGQPPEDATYSDGTPIVRPWNVAFYDAESGKRCKIIYAKQGQVTSEAEGYLWETYDEEDGYPDY